ncbi:MAG: DJ-1/PfpI family protein, partial [Planctomycetota bacterium]
STYFDDAEAHALAKAAAEKKKLIAAICVAPTILGKAGLLSGRDVTAFSSEQGILEEAGAKYQKKAVVFCEKGDFPLLTGADPYVAKEFAQALREQLLQIKKGAKAPPKKVPAKKEPAKEPEKKGATEGEESGSK